MKSPSAFVPAATPLRPRLAFPSPCKSTYATPVATPVRSHSISMCAERRTRPRTPPSSVSVNPLCARVASRLAEHLLSLLCTRVDNLHVQLSALSNRDVLSGTFSSLSISASALTLPLYTSKATISGGVSLFSENIQVLPFQRMSLAEPVKLDLHLALTEHDLNLSGGVFRNALQNALKQVVRAAMSSAMGRKLPSYIGGMKLVLDKVRLAENLIRMDAHAIATTTSTATIASEASANDARAHSLFFSVCAQLDVVKSHHHHHADTLVLKNPSLVWRSLRLPIFTVQYIAFQLHHSLSVHSVLVRPGHVLVDGTLHVEPWASSRRRPRTSYTTASESSSPPSPSEHERENEQEEQHVSRTHGAHRRSKARVERLRNAAVQPRTDGRNAYGRASSSSSETNPLPWRLR